MNTTKDTEIGVRLKAARKASQKDGKHISQAEFATALGLSLRAYQNYERGERPISKDLISSVVSVFGISTDWLLFGEGRMFRATPQTSTTNSELIAASYLISGAVEMAHWRFAGLCARIDATGKRVGDLTIDELLRLIREHRDHMERVEGGSING